jgi:hypothetical protein
MIKTNDEADESNMFVNLKKLTMNPIKKAFFVYKRP